MATWYVSVASPIASSQVRIIGSEQTEQLRTLAGDDGEVPISVRNERSDPDSTVVVRVKVISQRPGRLEIGEYDGRMVIAGGQTQTVRVPMSTTGASGGQTTVVVQLTTDDGRAYGQRASLSARGGRPPMSASGFPGSRWAARTSSSLRVNSSE